MNPVLLTHHRIGWLVGQIRPPAWSAAFVLKGTYDLRPDGVAVPSAEPFDITGDLHLDEDPKKLLRYPSDGVLFKPRTDLLLVGRAHAPAGATELHVGFHVGGFSKVLTAFGDRVTRRGFLSSDTSPAQPFRVMDIGYDRSYGGPNFPENPLGRGRIKDKDGLLHPPNIAYPGESKEEFPAGFGPIPPTWPQRTKKTGTYDKKWRKSRWPAVPEDFDWSYHNAAPADQQFPQYLRGDETISFQNLHPKHEVYRSRLPGIRARILYGDVQGSRIRLTEVPMNLDTLWVDAEAEKLVLVWRGVRDQATPDMAADDYVVAVSEPLTSPPRPLAEYEKEVTAHYFVTLDEEAQAVAAARAAEARPAKPGKEEEEEEEEAEEPEAEAKPAPPVEEEEAAVEEPAPPPPPPPEPVDRAWVIRRLQAGESLKGEDLSDVDLSGLDLRKADLRGTILARANLRKARLSEANLGGAILSEADLTDADLSRAALQGADLTQVRAGGADLREAALDEATLAGAFLEGAILARAHGTQVLMADARLSRADLTGISLPGAMAPGVTLHEANLSQADLSKASLEGAWGLRVNAEGATLSGLRAGGATFAESNFKKIQGTGSIWEGADLYHVDFFGAELSEAEFEGANLAHARLSAAILKKARLVKANLEHAEILRANLFQASMSGADARSADLSESNLFEADLLEMNAEGALLEHSNLKRTVLEPQS